MNKVGIHKKGEISLESILGEVHRDPSLERAGAIACFIGIVRGFSREGRRVKGLEYEADVEDALPAMDRIRREICRQEGIIDIYIHHIVDSFKVGEDVVYVVVAGRSREDVFPALSETIERVKSEVPIFKKEMLSEGDAYWVSEVTQQERDAEKRRWEPK